MKEVIRSNTHISVYDLSCNCGVSVLLYLSLKSFPFPPSVIPVRGNTYNVESLLFYRRFGLDVFSNIGKVMTLYQIRLYGCKTLVGVLYFYEYKYTTKSRSLRVPRNI